MTDDLRPEQYRGTPGGIFERYHLDGEKLVIETKQDTKELMRSNKTIQNAWDGWSKTKDMKHVARIPLILIHRWVQESGLKMGTREFTNYIARKVNDPEYAYLRIGKGQLAINE